MASCPSRKLIGLLAAPRPSGRALFAGLRPGDEVPPLRDGARRRNRKLPSRLELVGAENSSRLLTWDFSQELTQVGCPLNRFWNPERGRITHKVRKLDAGGHATSSYSWMSPPSRSCR